jgi:EAL domain-containing protein (putative c-di-GMP-specific phosphodiesterase class I)
VEALVRWAHPQLGLIPPASFISMTESTGAVAELGAWVLAQACADAAAWHRAGSPLMVSVNVSPRQFTLQDVPEIVATALRRSGLPAEALELELTESMHLSDDGSVTKALQRIDELGVVCAVDDFGTGYSSIAVLRDYPIGVVKLDRSFVQTTGGAVDAPLVRGVVQLAQGLGMRVVAEGVETEAQMAFVAGILCDEVQGFLVSRAVPASQIMSAIRNGGGDPTAVPSLVPVLRNVDERGLTELLWAEQEELERIHVRQPREMRLAAVLGNAGMLLAVPMVLGVGAGGGLPPELQAGLMSSMQAVGAEPSHPQRHGPPASHDVTASHESSSTHTSTGAAQPQAASTAPHGDAAATPPGNSGHPATNPSHAPAADDHPGVTPPGKSGHTTKKPATTPSNGPHPVNTGKPASGKDVHPVTPAVTPSAGAGHTHAPPPTTRANPPK